MPSPSHLPSVQPLSQALPSEYQIRVLHHGSNEIKVRAEHVLIVTPVVKFPACVFHSLLSQRLHCEGVKVSHFWNIICDARADHVIRILALKQVTKRVDLCRGEALRVISMPGLVRTVNVCNISVCCQAHPHLHVVRMC